MVAYPQNHGYTYMFDCGMASQLTISDILKLRAVFVTHTHIDHFINFDAIIRHRAGGRGPITITGPKGIAQNVQAKILAYTWNLIGKSSNCFEIREIIDEETFHIYKVYPPQWKLKSPIVVKSKTLLEQDGIVATFRILDHKIPSIAYKLSESNKVNIGDFPYKAGPWIAKLKELYIANISEDLEV
ncbi:MBL fold metallo-hydrolase, partial [bacterium]|nr:MBL fold metallo-hydrolase [bacterium]